jgi:hypothetical protein
MKCGLKYAEQELPWTLESAGTEKRGDDPQIGADFPFNCPKIRRMSADTAVKQVVFLKVEGIGVPWL